MPGFPETRKSLLLRIQSSDDAEAWREFVAIYRPVVYRLARRRGLQHADADDLAQRVMMSVRRAIGNWNADPALGRFRSWLARIARNAIINALTRRPPDVAAGGTTAGEFLEQQSEPRGIFGRGGNALRVTALPDELPALPVPPTDSRQIANRSGASRFLRDM